MSAPNDVSDLCERLRPGLKEEISNSGVSNIQRLPVPVTFMQLSSPVTSECWADKEQANVFLHALSNVTYFQPTYVDEGMLKRVEEKQKERNEKRAAKEAQRQKDKVIKSS